MSDTREQIENILKSYRLTQLGIEGDCCENYPLVDLLSIGDTVESGLNEIHLIADLIASEIQSRNDELEARVKEQDAKTKELEQQLANERRDNNGLYLNIYHSHDIEDVPILPKHLQNAWDKGQKLWLSRNTINQSQ